MACDKSTVVMGGVSWRGGSQEVARPITTAQLKMEDACNIIEIFWWKNNQNKKGRALWPFKAPNNIGTLV